MKPLRSTRLPSRVPGPSPLPANASERSIPGPEIEALDGPFAAAAPASTSAAATARPAATDLRMAFLSTVSELLHRVLGRGSRGRLPTLEAQPALGAEDRVARVHDELAARGALEARAAQQREQLLLERPVERRDAAHSDRKTPVTRPSTCT